MFTPVYFPPVYFSPQYFPPGTAVGGALTIYPNGVAITISVGNPALVSTIAPQGLSLPVTVGEPKVSSVIAPDGIGISIWIGHPFLTGALSDYSLQITDSQKTLILDSLDANLESAFASGVAAPSTPSVIPSMPMYTRLTLAQRQATKDAFKQIAAALIVTLNIDRPTPATKATTTFQALSGKLVTVTDGMIVSVV